MSALFPLEKNLDITEETRPLTQTGSIQVFIQLAEQNLFVQGFETNEIKDRPPTLLRGSLVLRVVKATKIKTINLTFKGIARTEWPEGIPPKRNDFLEENVLVEHTWPFFNQQDSQTSGANIVKSPTLNGLNLNLSEDMSTLNLDNSSIRSSSNALSVLRRVTSPSPNRARSGSMKSAFGFGGNGLDTTSIYSTANNEQFVFQPGDYVYNFEHPIPTSSPESCETTFGSISYSLNLAIERIGAFKSNIHTSLPIRIIRAPSDESVEDSEPIAISRDWEDKLHYDIIIASKAIILNAFLPIAFRLTPLDKIKLHRIRIYITENVEYYCRNKKVHRMEPTKKYLVLEHKAPPPKNLPEDTDPKAKKMGNLLTTDGDDLTFREFEYQVYIPQKLNNRQTLHPNISYTNIKSHHWIKLCLRLSRIQEGKPKHYEISIDSPIHVLDPLCSHANTLLPAYGLDMVGIGAEIENHESNIYFPKDLIPSSPPLSPEVEPISLNGANNVSSALSQVFHPGRSRSATSIRSEAPSSTRSSHLTPPQLNSSETTVSNIYKPDFDTLQLELTSPQAIPISPVVSPAARPIHLIRRPSYEPPPFDADISPPPLMRSPLDGNSRRPSVSLSINSNGNNAIGISGLLSGDVGLGDGIDSLIQSPPKDPPTYDEIIQQDILKSPKSPKSPLRFGANGITVSRTIPEIRLDTTSSSPTPLGSPNQVAQGDSRKPRQLVNNEDDIASSFSFSGGDLNMPASVLRSTSPVGQRLRSTTRDARSTLNSAENSRKNSFTSLSSRDAENAKTSLDKLRKTLGGPSDNTIDDILNHENDNLVNKESNNVSNDDATVVEDLRNQAPLEEFRGRECHSPDVAHHLNEDLLISRMSSRSSTSPRTSRVHGYRDDDENPIEGMEPLLHTLTAASYSQSLYSLDGNTTSGYGGRNRFESRESLAVRREPSSVDITALYTNNHPGFLAEMNDLSKGTYNHQRRNNSVVSSNIGTSFAKRKSSLAATGTPILAALDDSEIVEETDEGVTKGRSNVGNEEAIMGHANNNSGALVGGEEII